MGSPHQRSPWTAILVVILALLQVLCVQAQSDSSSALGQARLCILAGGVLDFYSQKQGLPQCLRNGLCPAGAVQAHSQCVAEQQSDQSREIGMTIQVGCDDNCVRDEGVSTAAHVWFTIARLLRTPMQEGRVAMLLMSRSLQDVHPLEFFTMVIPGESRLQTSIGTLKNMNQKWDLFLGLRIHTARIGAAANELRTLLSGDISAVAQLGGLPISNLQVFDIAERRTPGTLRNLDSVNAAYKVSGFAWNQRPTGSASNTSPPPSPPSYSHPSPAPAANAAPAPAPPPQQQGSAASAAAPAQAVDCAAGCKSTMIGDGVCNVECQYDRCQWDKDDCHVIDKVGADNDPKLPGCGCQNKWLGNGICETFCNYDACNFDGGDCASSSSATNAPLHPTPAPAPRPPPVMDPVCGCDSKWIGDGICDAYCNTPGCEYDGGDCPRPWNAPPTPAPPSRSIESPAPPPPLSAASGFAPLPAPAPVSAPAQLSGQSPSPALRGSSSGAQASTFDKTGTKVVTFQMQENDQTSSGGYDDWRVVATHDDGAKTYADDGSKVPATPQEDTSPVVTAAIVSVFVAAVALLALTAICILVVRTRKEESAVIENIDSKGNWIAPKKAVFMDGQHVDPRPADGLYSKTPSRNNPKVPTKAVLEMRQNIGRSSSKEHLISQDDMSTASTETPQSSRSTPGSTRSSETGGAVPVGRRRDPSKEPKVHPEPDPVNPPQAPQQPAPPPMPAWNRPNHPATTSPAETNNKSPTQQRRHSMPAKLDRAASKESKADPAPPPPPMPPHLRTGSKSSTAAAPTRQASTRQASKQSEPRQEPKAEPKKAPEAATSAGPRSAARAESQNPFADSADAARSPPQQPNASPSRSKVKAASSAKFTGWSWGKKASPSPSPSAASAASAKAKAKPQRSQSSPDLGVKGSWFGGSGPVASKEEKATQKKAKTLSENMMSQLDHAKSTSLEDRKKTFKDLQRQLHPDKNLEQAEAAKLAFQKLMEQRDSFLAS